MGCRPGGSVPGARYARRPTPTNPTRLDASNTSAPGTGVATGAS